MGQAGEMAYDPFPPGRFQVGVRTVELTDDARGRRFPCEIWYPASAGPADQAVEPAPVRDAPARPGPHPLLIYSHSSGGNRLSASFVCIHLASHGYVVAAMDHSEVVAPELARREGETGAELAQRVQAVIASRVPDVRFLLDGLLNGEVVDIGLDAARVGLVGHSFGGWTVLATTEVDPRVQSVVAMGSGGSSNPRPGILPVQLSFDWGRDVPTLYLAAEWDTPIPLEGVVELYERTPASKRLFVLRRSDHQHFVDDVEGEHEALRAMSLPGDSAWLPAAMRPMSELCAPEQAHLFVRGLTLAHLDATLRTMDAAKRFLDGDIEAELAARHVDAFAHRAHVES